MLPEHQPVECHRSGQEDDGHRREKKADQVDVALCMAQLDESGRKGQRQEESEEHLDPQPGHAAILQQFPEPPVVALGSGLLPTGRVTMTAHGSINDRIRHVFLYTRMHVSSN